MNGNPARMLAGNAFEATVAALPGTNTFTVEATDASSNVTTQSYEVAVTGTTASYSYDANGNLIQKTANGSVWAYTWNAENQLVRVTKDSIEVATFNYDPLGRRVEKAAGGVTTGFAYDGEDILRETRTGGTVFKYVHGPGIDEPLAREDQAAAWNYYHVDGLGSVLKRTSQSASIVHEYRYDSWGSIESGASEAGYAFTGREWDPETGLYYYRHRYYGPDMGRFPSEDPIGYAGGLNLYEYVSSNPSGFGDPLGLTGIRPTAHLVTTLHPPVQPCKPSQRMSKCLEQTLGKPVDPIKVTPLPMSERLGMFGVLAMTIGSHIYSFRSCDSFWDDERTVLEEYYHVTFQWQPGHLTVFRYLYESFHHGYDENAYEHEAQAFVEQTVDAFESAYNASDRTRGYWQVASFRRDWRMSSMRRCEPLLRWRIQSAGTHRSGERQPRAMFHRPPFCRGR